MDIDDIPIPEGVRMEDSTKLHEIELPNGNGNLDEVPRTPTTPPLPNSLPVKEKEPKATPVKVSR